MLSNYKSNIILDNLYSDKKDTYNFIKDILNTDTLLLNDIINIVLSYTNINPLCFLCKGKGDRNIIIQYCDIKYKYYDEDFVDDDDTYMNCNRQIEKKYTYICITCLYTKIPNIISYSEIISEKN